MSKSNAVILTLDTAVFEHSWCLSSSLSLSVDFSIQDEAMDVARSAPQGAHYHVDVIYLNGIKKRRKGLMVCIND